MTERELRVEMQPRWKAVQERFITLCGGDPQVMHARAAEREAMEAPLIAEYHERAAALQPRDSH